MSSLQGAGIQIICMMMVFQHKLNLLEIDIKLLAILLLRRRQSSGGGSSRRTAGKYPVKPTQPRKVTVKP